ncbi:MAG: putative PEP-CTERM system TPR-repeat lipoprotein [Halioglobus sp.]|jgi:putative PEP-CTERM system TPR-repeat lipoprotein
MEIPKITKTCRLLAAIFLAQLAACGQTISDDEYLERARDHLSDADPKSAVIELKNALIQNSKNNEARLQLAQLYIDTGDILSAEKELQRLHSDDTYSNDNSLLPLLAEVWVILGKADEALNIGTEDLEPAALARVLAAQSQADIINLDLDSAALRVEAAIALAQPQSLVYVRTAMAGLLFAQRKLAESSDVLGELHVLIPDNARIWALHGDVQQVMGNLDLSQEYYTKAIDLDVSSYLYLMKRAYLNIQMKQYELAQKDIDVLMGLAPQSTQVNYAQGLVHYFTKEYEDAVSALLIAKSEEFQYPQVNLYLGLSYLELKEIDKAYNSAEDYYAVERGNSTGNKLLSALRIAHGKYSEAEQLVRTVLQRHPNDIAALNILASSLISQNRFDEAIEVLASVVELDPESAQAQVRLGLGYASSGKSGLALDSIQHAISLNPELEQADTLLVLTHLKNNDYDSALDAAKTYQQNESFKVAPLLLLARVYESVGDTEAARKSYLEAIDLEPANPSANHSLAVIAFSKNDVNSARTYYNNVLDNHEDFLPTLMRLAVLDASIKDYDAMVTRLNQAIEKHPEAIQPRIVLARHYLSTAQPEKVQSLLVGLPEEWQNTPLVLRLLSRSQYEQGLYSDMRYSLEKVVQLGQATGEDHQSLAAAYEQLKDKGNMKLHVSKTLALNPDNVSALLAKATEAYSNADGPSLEKYLSRIEKLAPDNIDLKRLQAGYARVKGDQQSALVLLEQIYNAEPSTPAMLNLQQQYLNVGNPGASLSLMQDWLGGHKNDLPARLALANHFLEAGDKAALEREYKAVLDLDGQNLIALNNLAWSMKESSSSQALLYAQSAVRASNNASVIVDTLAMVQSANGLHEDASQTIKALLQADPGNPTLRYHSALIAVAGGQKDAGRRILQALIDDISVFPDRNEALEVMKDLSVND